MVLAFFLIPGNAISFWIRHALRWSRGRPTLPQESKENLFSYLADQAPGALAVAEARESELLERYHLMPLANASSRALYRKNLYLLDVLEKACEGLPYPPGNADGIKALDVGVQDWHYVFALERWLRFGNGGRTRRVVLKGIEVDGYGTHADFRTRKEYAQAYIAQMTAGLVYPSKACSPRKDYANAYIAQMGNPEVTFEIEDFLKSKDHGYDLITLFYPFVTKDYLLSWGLPLRFFKPMGLLAKAAAMTRPGGWMLVFTHTLKEQESFLELGGNEGGFELMRQGRALSDLVDFHKDVMDRRYSVWRRRG